MFTRAALAALVACATACGSLVNEPPRPDAALSSEAPASNPAGAGASLTGSPKVDADHDGHMANADCNDGDPAVWQILSYSFRDADGDGYSVAASGTICSGDDLPAGYSATPGPGKPDCDDVDPVAFAAMTGFVDLDSDGVGTGMALLFCTAGGLPAGFAVASGDCAPADPLRWIDLPYSFRDADGDGAAVVEVGVVCSGAVRPAGYLASAPAGQPDCEDADADASREITIFVDLDHDGVCAGPALLACTDGSPPAGFASTGTDCADDDGAVWESLPYIAVDLDGDGVRVPALGMRCTAGVLLPPYYAAPMGNDCDDANSSVSVVLTVFADADHDGFGAGPAQIACTDGSPPAGFAATGTDCDDGNASRWVSMTYSAVDADGDGVTVPAAGQVCTNGALPPPFKAAASGNDCDDTAPLLTHIAVLYPDLDGDGVGAPPRQIECIGAVAPASFTRGGYDDDDADSMVIEAEDDDELDLVLGL